MTSGADNVRGSGNASTTEPGADAPEVDADTAESRHGNPAGLVREDFSGGLNVTEKSNNFEMDYDEPTLPPSLPNLKYVYFKIFHFSSAFTRSTKMNLNP